MPKPDSKAGKSGSKKKLPAAPLQTGPAAPDKVKKDGLFEKRHRNFRIGGSILPKGNLTRFTKWPEYVRLQRQKRILLQRLKVPPSIAQFQHTLDKTQLSQLLRLCKKIAPESKAQKKDRLKSMAADKAGTQAKGLPVLKYGIHHVTDLIEQKKAKLVCIAHDVDPVELVCWMPALCRKKDVAYCVVKSKSRLGQLVGLKTASCVAITNVAPEDQKDLEVLCDNFKAAFNDNREVQRKWGGGIMGVKSNHVTRHKQMLIEKELAKKTGLML